MGGRGEASAGEGKGGATGGFATGTAAGGGHDERPPDGGPEGVGEAGRARLLFASRFARR